MRITIRSLCLKKYRMSFFRLIMMLWHVFRERLKRQSQIFTQEKQNTWKEMKDLLIATCSLPILFQPVKIGRHYYLDGGLADSVPYEHAMEMGCEKLVVVLTRERGYVKTQEKAAGVMNRLYQRYPKIVENMKLRAERYNASMEKLMQLEKEEKVFVIAPESTYGVGRTETDTIKLRRLYDEGYRIATEQTDALRAYLNK